MSPANDPHLTEQRMGAYNPVMPFLAIFASYQAAKRALMKDQGRAETSDISMWRLLVAELPILSRRVGAVRVTSIVVVFVGLVIAAEVALSEVTPGPWVSPRWRVVLAIAATALFVLVWTLVHAARSVDRRAPRNRELNRV